jgi:hypothetical protein
MQVIDTTGILSDFAKLLASLGAYIREAAKHTFGALNRKG